MKYIKTFLLLSAALATSSIVQAQDEKQSEIKRIVEAPNYVFVAQKVSPMGKGTRDLTPDYDLTITKDTIVSYLPYFGRSYTGTLGSSDGGIKFTSTKFDYTKKDKDSKWSITIKPKDAPDVQQMHLDIFDNGTATLQVISTNRQNISFNGYIKEGKPGAKKAF